MTDTCWWMASFSVDNDGGLSRYTFDFKNPDSQQSQGVRSGDLGDHEFEKDRLITRSSPDVECSRRCTSRAVCSSAPYCITVTVCSVGIAILNDIL
ncbi:hypothetical protein AVEN_97566-1 [Araneus ventricosus]|uniref:Uncharacterized protein n=1 Tax=Araneus ventricosus TaxID=182803 RepID=A0A4Y2F5V6_ARAVE|nr:hypothetical protein AVEN_97566-1 [Araneus ventricosus]